MKIGHQSDKASPQAPPAASKPLTPAQQQQAALEGQSKTAPQVAAASGVPLTLSRMARSATSEPALAGRSQNGDFDAAKVKAMRASIESGTFRINADEIADKLLTNARETLEHSSASRR